MVGTEKILVCLIFYFVPLFINYFIFRYSLKLQTNISMSDFLGILACIFIPVLNFGICILASVGFFTDILPDIEADEIASKFFVIKKGKENDDDE